MAEMADGEMAARVFSTSLTCLSKFTSADVVKSVEIHSSTKGNKLDKGYKFFHEEFIHNSNQVSNIHQGQVVVRGRCFRSMRKSEEPHKLEISLEAESANLKAFSCSCAAGKGFCNHIVAILYQTAHYSQLGLQAVPPSLACTSGLQRWHRPRTQGIHPEPVSELVVQKPKTVGKNGLRSTLYKAYTGSHNAGASSSSSSAAVPSSAPQPITALVQAQANNSNNKTGTFTDDLHKLADDWAKETLASAPQLRPSVCQIRPQRSHHSFHTSHTAMARVPNQMRGSIPAAAVKLHLPLSCPLSAALGPIMPHGITSGPSPIIQRGGYLMPTASFTGMMPGPVYPHQWSGLPSPVGMFGTAAMVPYPTMASPTLQTFPLAVKSPDAPMCPSKARTA